MRATRLAACEYKRCQGVQLGKTTNVPTFQLDKSRAAGVPTFLLHHVPVPVPVPERTATVT